MSIKCGRMSERLAKLLFPKVPRQVRARRMQALRFTLVMGVLTLAAVSALLYFINDKMRH